MTGLSSPDALLLVGNDLYFSDYDEGTVFKIDITDTNPTPTEIVAGLSNPSGLAFDQNENDLYIAENGADKISKIDITTTLSTNDISKINPFRISPNPASEVIEVSGLTQKENYAIHNIIGAQIARGNASNNEKIYIGNLNNGIYFLKFDNGNTIKLIKE